MEHKTWQETVFSQGIAELQVHRNAVNTILTTIGNPSRDRDRCEDVSQMKAWMNSTTGGRTYSTRSR